MNKTEGLLKIASETATPIWIPIIKITPDTWAEKKKIGSLERINSISEKR